MLINIIKLISGQQITELSLAQDLKVIVEQLLSYLRQDRCLLVLDNLETILQTNAVNYEPKESDYIKEHQGYGQLIEIFADTHHQSCLLLTGREIPGNFIDRTRNNSLVYSLLETLKAN